MRKQKPSPQGRGRKPMPFSDVTVVPDDDGEAIIGPGNEQNNRRRWKPAELAAAFNCKHRGDVTALAQRLGRTTQSVRHMRHKLRARKLRPGFGGGGTSGALKIGSYTLLMRRIWDEHERAQSRHPG